MPRTRSCTGVRRQVHGPQRSVRRLRPEGPEPDSRRNRVCHLSTPSSQAPANISVSMPVGWVVHTTGHFIGTGSPRPDSSGSRTEASRATMGSVASPGAGDLPDSTAGAPCARPVSSCVHRGCAQTQAQAAHDCPIVWSGAHLQLMRGGRRRRSARSSLASTPSTSGPRIQLREQFVVAATNGETFADDARALGWRRIQRCCDDYWPLCGSWYTGCGWLPASCW